MSTPHTKQPKTRGPYKKSYSHAKILLALADLRSARLSGRKLSHASAGAPYGIPGSTVHDWEKKTSIAIASAPRYSIPAEVMETAVSTTRTGLHLRLITEPTEAKLVTWIHQCDDVAQPPDTLSVRLKAMRLHYAENDTPITSENYDKLASEHWWNRFFSRHPQLALRTSQPLGLKRAKATQPEIFNHFYDLLEHWIIKLQLQPHQVWAGDETGVDEKFRVRKVVTNMGTNTHTNTHRIPLFHAHASTTHPEYFFIFFCRHQTCTPIGLKNAYPHVHHAYL